MAHENHQPAPRSPPIDLDLRTRDVPRPANPDMKRFDIFLIDTGWNRPISKIVRSHLPLFYEYQKHDSLYLLTPEQSVEILKARLSSSAATRRSSSTTSTPPLDASTQLHGFRLNLGLMRHPEQAMARLQEFVRFIATPVRRALDSEVRRELHREGIEGIVKILRETSTELLTT